MGRTKGLLPAPSSTSLGVAGPISLIERLLMLCARTVKTAPVLVGHRREYDFLGLETLSDVVDGSGPMAGMVSLLAYAKRLELDQVVAVACDLPYVTEELLGRLVQTPADSLVLCPKSDDKFEALFARYRVEALPLFQEALEQGRLSLQPVLRRLGPQELTLSVSETLQLRDWDEPEDVTSDDNASHNP